MGARAAAAAVCPPELVLALARGLQAQREEDCKVAGIHPPLSAAIVQAVTGDIAGLKAVSVAKVVCDE